MKRVKEGLEENDLSLDQIRGICITHEHSDHIGGLGPILRKYDIPVYGTEETLRYIMDTGKMKNVDLDLFEPVQADCPIQIDGMEVTPFSISHDARNPVCYTIEKDEKKISVATDMGTYDEYIMSHLENSQVLLLEANHDINMLQVGRDVYKRQQQIRLYQNIKHLSSNFLAFFLCKNLIY